MHTVKYTLKLPEGKARYYAVTFDTHAEALKFQTELLVLPGNFIVEPYIVEGM